MSARFVGPRRLVPAPMREHFTRVGDAKRKYSQADAKIAAERHHKSCYRCRLCGQWHLGGGEMLGARRAS